MKHLFFRNMLIALMTLLGLGAVYGGGLLVISPYGDWLGVPISLLDESPFHSFFIPGLILFLVLGVAPLLVAWALKSKFENKLLQSLNFFKDMHWAWSYTIYISFALIIWIQMQMVFLNTVYWVHTLYMFWAVVMLFIALLPQVRRIYREE